MTILHLPHFSFLLLLLLLLPSKSSASVEALFRVTKNISTSSFSSYTKKSLKAESVLACASRCLYWQDRSSYCNAFR